MNIRYNILVNRYITLFILIALTILLSGSILHSGSVRGVTDRMIKIGVLLDQTGPTAGDIALPATRAIRNYTQHINDSGGIMGRKFKLIVEDDRYSIPAGLAAFKKLIFKDKVFALVGPACTGEAKILISHIEKQRVPNITGAPAKVMIEPIRRHIFLPFNIYEDQLGVIFDYIINDIKPKRLVLTFVYFDSESGKAAHKATKKWAKYYSLHFNTEIIQMGALDAASQVMSIKRKKTTFIIIHHTSPSTVALLRDLKKFGMNIPVYGTLPTCAEDTVRMGGNASKNYVGIHGFSSWNDDSEGMENIRKITLKYKPDIGKVGRNRFYTTGWIFSTVLYEGIRRSGKEINIKKLITSIETIRDYDTKGVVGPITFSPTNHKGLDYCKLYRANPEEGKLVPITGWRKAPAKKEGTVSYNE
ncbi:MAG: ABC transporter substrate-binding protein [Spirochaetota bacterium]|nr:ABC transporter substrate-binding protein [Spirochaetota bacterium]